jgi:hypothetical protein
MNQALYIFFLASLEEQQALPERPVLRLPCHRRLASERQDKQTFLDRWRVGDY